MPENILEEAARITAGDRQQAYGHPLDNNRRVALLWDAYLAGRKPGPLQPEDVGHMMLLFKIARAMNGPKRDTNVDLAGYAWTLQAIAEERERRVQNGPDKTDGVIRTAVLP